MKNIILLILSIITLNSFGQIGTKIKYKQMENPATSSVNLGSQTFSAGTSYLTNSTTIGTGTVAANTTSLGILRVKQGSSKIDIGEGGYEGVGYSCMWSGQSTNTSTNPFLQAGTNYLTINNGQSNTGSISMGIAANNRLSISNTSVYITPATRIGSNTLPTATLDVTGNIKISATTNTIGGMTLNSASTVTTTMPATSGTVANLSDALFTYDFATATSNNLNDATTYYMGSMPGFQFSTNALNGYYYLPYNCTLIGYSYNSIVAGVLGSAENTTLSVNGSTTQYTLSSTVNFSNAAVYTNTFVSGLSQNFDANESINIKFISPTWATNPTNLHFGVKLYFVRRQ